MQRVTPTISSIWGKNFAFRRPQLFTIMFSTFFHLDPLGTRVWTKTCNTFQNVLTSFMAFKGFSTELLSSVAH